MNATATTTAHAAMAAIHAFRAAHGRGWRAKLSALWARGEDEGDLRLARNLVGPSGLRAIR